MQLPNLELYCYSCTVDYYNCINRKYFVRSSGDVMFRKPSVQMCVCVLNQLGADVF